MYFTSCLACADVPHTPSSVVETYPVHHAHVLILRKYEWHDLLSLTVEAGICDWVFDRQVSPGMH